MRMRRKEREGKGGSSAFEGGVRCRSGSIVVGGFRVGWSCCMLYERARVCNAERVDCVVQII